MSAANLPDRDLVTTREICAWRRITPETLTRRRKSGALKLTPCDRGRELLFLRDDVLRAFGHRPVVAPLADDIDPWM